MKSRGSFCSRWKQKVSFPQSMACISSISIIIWATLHILALWPRFFELDMNIDSLTVCYHNCVLVVRLFGLLIQNPGSVNTSKHNMVERVKKNQTILEHCIWQTKKCLSRTWESLRNVPELIFTLVHLFNAYRLSLFLQTVGEKPLQTS